MQLTAWAFAGPLGEHARTVAVDLVRSAPRVLIASDAHGLDRPPALRLALDAVRGAGVREPQRLADAVPRALLTRGLAVRPPNAAALDRQQHAA